MIARIVNGIYYTFAGLWFGAMVMLAISAAVTFKTVRAQMPAAEPAAQNIFAGNIVGNLIDALAVVQMICAVVIVVCIILQSTAFSYQLKRGMVNYLRVALLLVPVALLAFDRLHVNPTIRIHRAAMVETNDADAKAAFDQYHTLAERLGGATTFLLAGAILISPLALQRETGPSPDDHAAG